MANDISKIRHFKIDGNSILSYSLIDQIKNLINSLADENYIVIQILGSKDQKILSWPGKSSETDVHMISQWEQALRQLEQVNTQTISTIEGHCNECGLQLLLTTDFRIIQKEASIEINDDGIWPGMAIHRLANQLGNSAARRVIFFEKIITSNKASKFNLIDIVAEDIEREKNNFLSNLKDSHSPHTALRRTLLIEATSEPFETALGSHLAACDRILRNQ